MASATPYPQSLSTLVLDSGVSMATPLPTPTPQDFIDLFKTIGRNKHRYTVFSDFVTIAAITLHNAIRKDMVLEEEYLSLIKSYDEPDRYALKSLFQLFIDLMNTAPVDHLGGIYMSLGFGEELKGQFFTPYELSRLMAEMTLAELIEKLKTQPYITMSDPACGAGGTLLPAVSMLISKGYNPATTLWVQAVDIDRVSALMCYIQLSLWNVPAQVVVGNSLTLEVRETWHTPAHYLYDWEGRKKTYAMIEKFRGFMQKIGHVSSPSDDDQVVVQPPLPEILLEPVPTMVTEPPTVEATLPASTPPIESEPVAVVGKKSRKKSDPQLGFSF
jgi:hypothetical protein